MKKGDLVKFSVFGTENLERLGVVIEVRNNPADLKFEINTKRGDQWPRKIADVYSEGTVLTAWVRHLKLVVS